MSVTDIVKSGVEQISLFPDEKKEKSRKVDKAIDAIRDRFGTGTIVSGTSYGSHIDVGKKHKAQLDDKNKR